MAADVPAELGGLAQEEAQAASSAPPRPETVPGKWPLRRTLQFVLLASTLLWVLIFVIGWLVYGAL